MSETVEHDARTQVQTVRIEASAWTALQNRDELQICGSCDTFWNPSDLENGRCPICQPRPDPVFQPGELSITLDCGCIMSRTAAFSAAVSWHHCAPKVPSQQRVTSAIITMALSNGMALFSNDADILARAVISEWATLNEVDLPQEDPALPPMDEGWLTEVIRQVIPGMPSLADDIIRHIIQQQRDHTAAQAELAAMHNAAVEEDFNRVRHPHDTAGLHEEKPFEDVQSLSGPETVPARVVGPHDDCPEPKLDGGRLRCGSQCRVGR